MGYTKDQLLDRLKVSFFFFFSSQFETLTGMDSSISTPFCLRTVNAAESLREKECLFLDEIKLLI